MLVTPSGNMFIGGDGGYGKHFKRAEADEAEIADINLIHPKISAATGGEEGHICYGYYHYP